MPKCSYCGQEYHVHQGVTYVQNDGNIIYLCSSKCRKNRILQRRKVRWVLKNTENKALAKTKEANRANNFQKA